MEKREKPWNRVFHIVEKENCVYNKSLWIFVKEKNVRIWIGYRKRKRHIREQRNKEWSRAMVRWSADDIIYEDEQILVCRKHSGMAVQSARVGQMDLESELRNYRNGNYIGIVQRLDQPVEGVLVFGKTPQATAWLNKQHQNGMMKKEYLAVFTGTPVKEKQGIGDTIISDIPSKNSTSNTGGVIYSFKSFSIRITFNYCFIPAAFLLYLPNSEISSIFSFLKTGPSTQILHPVLSTQH